MKVITLKDLYTMLSAVAVGWVFQSIATHSFTGSDSGGLCMLFLIACLSPFWAKNINTK